MVAFVILFLSLLESIYEQILLVRGEEEEALILNRVCRVAICFGIYPLSLVYLFVAGPALTWSNPAALTVFICGLLFTLIVSVVAIKRLKLKGKGTRLDVVNRLRSMHDFTHVAFGECLREAFDAFDLDNSGLLSIAEARDLFHVLYFEQIGALRFPDAMLIVRQFADGDGQLDYTSLLDAIIKVGKEYEVNYPTAAITTMKDNFEERWNAGEPGKKVARGLPDHLRKIVRVTPIRPEVRP